VTAVKITTCDIVGELGEVTWSRRGGCRICSDGKGRRRRLRREGEGETEQ